MIGVDRMANLIEAAMKSEGGETYPPYDIQKTGEDSYRIRLAAAGFSPDELELTAQPNLLIVAGRKKVEEDSQDKTYLHRGLAGRDFERRFELADYVVVKSADFTNGLLSVDLVREVPEALRPRRVEISTGKAPASVTQIEQSKTERRAA
jgi:molecular chaperone IbpA